MSTLTADLPARRPVVATAVAFYDYILFHSVPRPQGRERFGTGWRSQKVDC